MKALPKPERPDLDHDGTVDEIIDRRIDPTNTKEIDPEGTGVAIAAVVGGLSTAVSVGASVTIGQILAGAALNAGLALLQKEMSESQRSLGSGDFESSPTYGFDNVGTSFRPVGEAVPVVWGEERHGGKRIQSFTTQQGKHQYLHVLLLVSKGPVEAVAENIEIAGQPLDNHHEVEVYRRRGEDNQRPIEHFQDQIIQQSQSSRTLSADSWQQFTTTEKVDRLSLGFLAPQGIFETTDSGNTKSNQVEIDVEYKKQGTSNWIQASDYHEIDAELFTDQVEKTSKYGQRLELIKPAGGYNDNKIFIDRANNIHYGYIGGSLSFDGDKNPWAVGNTIRLNGEFESRVKSVQYEEFEGERWKEIHLEDEIELSSGSINKLEQQTLFDIKAKSRNPVRREFRINLPQFAKYDFRIRRKNAESSDASTSDKINLSFYKEIQEDTLSYDGYALLGVRIRATDQLSGNVPDFKFTTLGRRALDNVSIVDKTGFTKNPVWCMWDALTMPQPVGAGLKESTLKRRADEWKDAADYCNVGVKDGEGGIHARYELDFILDQQMRVPDFTDHIANTFNAFMIYTEGSIYPRINKPNQDPVMLYSPQNIKSDDSGKSTLQLSYVSRKKLYNSVKAEFRDRKNDYEKRRMVVPREEGMTGDDLQPQHKINMAGITRPAQVVRASRLKLRESNDELLLGNWKAQRDSYHVEPGDLVHVGHWLPTDDWGEIQGALTGHRNDAVFLDQEIDFDPAKDYDVTVKLDDGKVYDLRIDNPGRKTNIAPLVDTFNNIGAEPYPFSPYVAGEVQMNRVPMRLLAVRKTGQDELELNAVEHDETKFTGLDEFDLDQKVISAGIDEKLPEPVESLNLVEENLTKDDGSIETNLHVYWTPPNIEGVEEYRVYLDDQPEGFNENFERVTSTTANDHVIKDVPTQTTVAVRVVTVMENGKILPIDEAPEQTTTLTGVTGRPPDVTTLELTQKNQSVIIDFSALDSPLADHYEVRRGPTWALSESVEENLTTSQARDADINNSTYRYMVKAVSPGGRYSENAISSTITVTGLREKNIVLGQDEKDLGWPGTKQNFATAQRDGETVLIPQHNQNWDDFLGADEQWDEQYGTNDTWGVSFNKDHVYTTNTKDIGKVHPLEVSLEFNINFLPGDATWEEIYGTNDTWMDAFDNAGETWEELEADPSFTIEYRTSDDGSTWTSWQEFQPFRGEFRYIEFRLSVTVESANDQLEIETFKPVLDVDDIIIEDEITVPSGGTTLTFSNYNDQTGQPADFLDPPTQINDVSVNNAKAIDFNFTNLTNDSVDVEAFDDTATSVEADLRFHIEGF